MCFWLCLIVHPYLSKAGGGGLVWWWVVRHQAAAEINGPGEGFHRRRGRRAHDDDDDQAHNDYVLASQKPRNAIQKTRMRFAVTGGISLKRETECRRMQNMSIYDIVCS